MKKLLLILFLFTFIVAHSQGVIVPNSFKATLKSKGLDKKYLLNAYLKNSSLQADFNGDSTQDLAVLIIEKTTKKKGILLMHGKTNQYAVFGAGTKFGNGSDNFKWANGWSLYSKKTAYEKFFNKENGDLIGDREVRLTRPGVLIKDEAGITGGLIYWDGKKYVWINQVD